MLRVEEIMTKDVISLTPYQTIEEAWELCEKHRIRHLPVVDEGRLTGLVSDRDLRDALPSVYDQNDSSIYRHRHILSIMKTEVITTHPLDYIEEAAFTMYTIKIGCLPVISRDQLVGIVTQTDLLHSLVELMGIHEPSSYIKVEVEDAPGRLLDVIQIIKDANVNIANFYITPSPKEGVRSLNFQIRTIDPRIVINAIQKKGYKVIWPQYSEEWL